MTTYAALSTGTGYLLLVDKHGVPLLEVKESPPAESK